MERVYKCFEVNKKYYVYDREVNKILDVSKAEYELLSSIKSDAEFEAHEPELKRLTDEGFLQKTVLSEIKHPATDRLEDLMNNKLEQVILQLTQNCNLRCSYCFYGNGNYDNRTHSAKVMDFETAKKGIDYLMTHSRDQEEITIGFYGGEPLLRMDLITQCVAYANEQLEGKTIHYSMTTNGTLLNDEVIDFLKENNFQLLISLDGTKEMHDANRKFANGKGSFETIMKNIKHIKELHPEYAKKVMFNTVITPKTDFECVKNFLQTDEVISNHEISKGNLNDLYTTNDYADYDEKYYIVNRYGVFKNFLVMLGELDEQYASRLFKVDAMNCINIHKQLTLGNKMTESGHPGGPCLPGVKRVFVNAEGNMYPCERVSESSEVMKIGNLTEGIDLEKAKKLINVGATTSKSCSKCWAFHYCLMCAAFSDDTKELVAKKRLARCHEFKTNAIEEFKNVCMLRELGYDFEREVF